MDVTDWSGILRCKHADHQYCFVHVQVDVDVDSYCSEKHIFCIVIERGQ